MTGGSTKSKSARRTVHERRKSGSLFRAERAEKVHKITPEEARNTEAKTTSTKNGKYATPMTAHIAYDMNDVMTDIVLETDPTEAQRAERQKERTDKQNGRTKTEEEELEIKDKYRPKARKACNYLAITNNKLARTARVRP
jgi:hypothetical protein